jgi:hypothetical protein
MDGGVYVRFGMGGGMYVRVWGGLVGMYVRVGMGGGIYVRVGMSGGIYVRVLYKWRELREGLGWAKEFT